MRTPAQGRIRRQEGIDERRVMSNIALIRQWITTFPGWQGDAPKLDALDVTPGSSGLYYEGLQRMDRLGDVLGHERVTCRYIFVLQRVLPHQESAALWLEDFEAWVLQQSLLKKTPVLHGATAPCDVRAEKSRLDVAKQTGTGVYSVRLRVEYTIE